LEKVQGRENTWAERPCRQKVRPDVDRDGEGEKSFNSDDIEVASGDSKLRSDPTSRGVGRPPSMCYRRTGKKEGSEQCGDS